LIPRRKNPDPTVTDYTEAPGPGCYREDDGFSLNKYESYKAANK